LPAPTCRRAGAEGDLERQELQWLDAQERTVFGELLDYVCKATPAR